MPPTFSMLDAAKRAAIAETTFRLLDEIGVRLTEPQGLALLLSAGARQSGDRVVIPPAMIEAALASAPREVTLYGRDGEPSLDLAGRNVYFGAHTDAPDVADAFTGQRRPCVREDVARHAALIEALPHIDYATASGLVADVPPDVADVVALAQCLKHTRKPVLVMPGSLSSLAAMREMAALVRGGEAVLRDQPLIVVYAEPLSPLAHPDASIRKLLFCAEHELPVVYSAYAAQGGTAPLSMAATIAQLTAESLSGLVVHQLRSPGAPFIFGGMASVMDMKTTLFSYGAPEFQLGNTLMAEMAHHFRLPNFGTAGTSDAQCFDGQAILEATSSCLLAMLSGANLVHDIGLLGAATLVSPEMIVATDELLAMMGHLTRDVPVDTETLSLELFSGVGQRAEFVTQHYTLEHLRDVWYPALFDRAGAKAWSPGSSPAFEERVNARTRRLLVAPGFAPLAAGVEAELDRIAQMSLERHDVV